MTAIEYEAGLQASLFSLEIDGVDLGFFSKVDGISYSVERIRSMETNAEGKRVEYASPGRVSFGDITLTRILTDDNALLDWHKTVNEDGDTGRKSGSIVMYDRAGGETGRWNFEGAWVAGWSTGGLDASTDGFVDETVIMSVDRIYRG